MGKINDINLSLMGKINVAFAQLAKKRMIVHSSYLNILKFSTELIAPLFLRTHFSSTIKDA